MSYFGLRPGAVGDPAVTGSATAFDGDPVRRPETPDERHARRKAFGAKWAPIAKQLGVQARARQPVNGG